MQPIPFKRSNTILEGTDQDPAKQARALIQDGVCITKWKATWRERVRILLFGTIWMTSKGDSMPPIFIGTDRPFDRKVKTPVIERLLDVVESL